MRGAPGIARPLTHVQVLQPDTDSSPYGIGAIGSRVTIAPGNAAMRAAKAARTQLLEQASRMMGVEPLHLLLENGAVRSTMDPKQRLELAAIARAHIWRSGGECIRAKAT